MRRFSLALALLLVLCIGAAGSVHAGTIVYSDSDFANGDWEIAMFNFHTGGSASAGQVATAGNPDSFREVVHTTNAATDPNDNAAIYTFHGLTSAVVDPSIDGAIASIDLFWDILPDATVNGGFSGAALRQGNDYYVIAGLLELHGTGQQWRSVQRLGLTEANYGLIQDILEIDPAQDPDFSTSGAPITFGFFSSLSGALGGPGATVTSGYDNWQVVVHTIPEPHAMALLLAAGLFAVAQLHRVRGTGTHAV
jgi:hypothetical protein